jgi:hypothetical protein
MSGKQATFAVLIMGVSVLAASATAQDEKNEVSGIVGRTFVSDQGVHPPNAPLIPVPSPLGSSTTGVVRAGLGPEVSPFPKRFSQFSFRGEVRDFYSGPPNLPLADAGKTRQHNYFVEAGLVWHV